MRRHRRKEGAPSGLWAALEEQARRMRVQATLSERLLWKELRGGKIGGLKFRRQHVVGRFIVDFYCVEAALVVEADGSIHEMQEDSDTERTRYLEALGLKVLRFTNTPILSDTQSVIEAIRLAAMGNR